ncbi:hypothetical protein J5893_01340 [bacterium]|nr:hypothetical protein [bacterium]
MNKNRKTMKILEILTEAREILRSAEEPLNKVKQPRDLAEKAVQLLNDKGILEKRGLDLKMKHLTYMEEFVKALRQPQPTEEQAEELLNKQKALGKGTQELLTQIIMFLNNTWDLLNKTRELNRERSIIKHSLNKTELLLYEITIIQGE